MIPAAASRKTDIRCGHKKGHKPSCTKAGAVHDTQFYRKNKVSDGNCYNQVTKTKQPPPVKTVAFKERKWLEQISPARV